MYKIKKKVPLSCGTTGRDTWLFSFYIISMVSDRCFLFETSCLTLHSNSLGNSRLSIRGRDKWAERDV